MSESTTVLVQTETVGATVIVTGATVIGTVPIGPQGPAGVVTADDVVDLFTGTPDGTQFLRDDGTLAEPAGGGGGVTDADFLVGTAHAGLSAEIVVGTSPGGELGGTWASPTVDATHSGSSHASVQAAAEATAAADATTKVAAEAALARNADNLTSGTVADARIASTIARDSEVSAAVSASEAGQVRDGDTAGGVLSGTYPNPGFAADMATQAELDAAIAAVPDEVFVEDPNTPGTYVVGPVYIGESDPAVGGEDPYVWLDPASLGAPATYVETVDGQDGVVDLSGTYAPLVSPTFTGNVVVPDADAATEAMNRQTADARYAPLSPLSVGVHSLASASGAPALVALGVTSWALDASSAEAVSGIVQFPSTWATYNAEAIWANLGAGAGGVSWRLDTCGFGAASDSWATFTNGSAVVATAGAQNAEVHTTLVSGATVPAGLSLSFRVFRIATAGGDTLANDAGLAAVRFTRAS